MGYSKEELFMFQKLYENKGWMGKRICKEFKKEKHWKVRSINYALQRYTKTGSIYPTYKKRAPPKVTPQVEQQILEMTQSQSDGSQQNS